MKLSLLAILGSTMLFSVAAVCVQAKPLPSISKLNPPPIVKGIKPPSPQVYSGRQNGSASYYNPAFQGKCCTASGETYQTQNYTASHPDLPFGTQVRVTNLYNQRSVVVRINDRSLVKERLIELSPQAFAQIGHLRQEVIRVKLEVISLPPVNISLNSP